MAADGRGAFVPAPASLSADTPSILLETPPSGPAVLRPAEEEDDDEGGTDPVAPPPRGGKLAAVRLMARAFPDES